MRSAFSKVLVLFLLAAAGAIAHGQVNPHTQIRWPANCRTSDGKIYNWYTNQCQDINAINPGTQLQWPATCTAGMVYDASINNCIYSMTNINPGTQLSWPGTCTTGSQVYAPSINGCVTNGTANNPAGSTGQMQYNRGGVFGASPSFTFDGSGNVLYGNYSGLITLNTAYFSGSDIAQKIITAATSCANNCTVEIPQGAYTLTGSATAPAGITLRLHPGAVVTIPTGVTWTINSRIDAGRWQIFAGPGQVSFIGNSYMTEVYPEWWGGLPDNGSCTIDASLGWNAAALAAQNMGINANGGTVLAAQARYSMFNTVVSYAMSGGGPQSPSFDGVPSNRVDGNRGSSLMWCGPTGGDQLHMIGGHTNRIRNLSFNATGTVAGTGTTAARNIWIDSNNARPTTSSNITSMVRSGCVTAAGQAPSVNCIVTITTATAEPTWVSGVEILFQGTSDQALNNEFLPIWYAVDTTHFVFSSYGVNGTIATPGTATSQATGDVSQFNMSDLMLAPAAAPMVNISSCSIASNVMTCTLASPTLLYPGRWIWINGATDPVYNGYQQITTVTSPTRFTATQTYNASEASTASGIVYAPSSGVAFGTNDLSIATNSVCCTTLTNVTVAAAYQTDTAISGYEMDASSAGNSYSFAWFNSPVLGPRIGWMFFNKGSLKIQGGSLSSIRDSIIASPWTYASVEVSGIEYENLNPYFISSLSFGSYNSAVAGANGQFEVGGNPGQCFIHDNAVFVNGYGGEFSPDNIAMFLNCNARIEGNRFDSRQSISATAQNVVGVTYTAGSGQTPGTYLVTATGGGCAKQPVLTVTVGADQAVDVAGSNTNPVLISFAGFGCTSTPTFTLSAGGTAATFTPLMGAVPWVVPNSPAGATGGQIVSVANNYTQVPFGGYGPFLNTSHSPYFGPAKANNNPVPIETINDLSFINAGAGVLPSGSNASVFLQENKTSTKLQYIGTAATPDADSGFVRVPNSVPFACARDVFNTNDACLSFDASNNLVVTTNAGVSSQVIPSNPSVGYSIGPYSNQVKDSSLQSVCASGCSWISAAGPTYTTNAGPDILGGNTALQIGPGTGSIQQTTGVAMTVGNTYAASFYAQATSGTAPMYAQLHSAGGNTACHLNQPPGMPSSFTVDTTLTKYTIYCSPTVNDTLRLTINTNATTVPVNISTVQVAGSPWCSTKCGTTGPPVTTTTAPVSGNGVLVNGVAVAVLAGGTMGVIPTQVSGKAICETATHTLGHCSTQPDSTGSCTCN